MPGHSNLLVLCSYTWRLLVAHASAALNECTVALWSCCNSRTAREAATLHTEVWASAPW